MSIFIGFMNASAPCNQDAAAHRHVHIAQASTMKTAYLLCLTAKWMSLIVFCRLASISGPATPSVCTCFSIRIRASHLFTASSVCIDSRHRMKINPVAQATVTHANVKNLRCIRKNV